MNKARILSKNEDSNFRSFYLSKVFTGDMFPYKAFTENDWHFYTFFWTSHEYSNIQNIFSMAQELGEKSIYLNCPYILNEDYGIIELPFDIGKEDISYFVDNYPYFAFDYVLLGTKNEWGIYVGQDEDYAILGCSPKVQSIVEKYYNLVCSKFDIEGGEGLIDCFLQGAWRIDSYKGLIHNYAIFEKIKKNYPSLFTSPLIELGSIICLPLRDSSGYSIVVIARKQGATLLGYFMNIKLKEIADFALVPLNLISPSNMINISMFDTLGIMTGDWTIVGKLKDFNKEDWTIPLFSAEDLVFRPFYYLDHFDENLERVLRERQKTKEEVVGSFYDVFGGYRAIERQMTEILKNVLSVR